jgi:hypothetical protein
MNFFTELDNRISSDSPKFFKILQALGLYLTGAAGSVLVIPGIPENLKVIAGYALTAGAVLAAVSKLPVKDPDYSTLDKKKDENIK